MTPADIDPARILAWLEEEMVRSLEEADEATRAHLLVVFGEIGSCDPESDRRMHNLLGQYIALAKIAGAARSGKFDRQP